MTDPTLERGDPSPELSLVMPCYNEEEVLGYTVSNLLDAFSSADIPLEIVAVDNGSTDRTGEIIAGLAATDHRVVPQRVEVNQGYGLGMLTGIPSCRAPWIGFICADGEVDAEDVVRLFQATRKAEGPIVAKVRRRFRMDGLKRKVVSAAYNFFTRFLWPGLRSIDINGTPKILNRDLVHKLQLEETGWFFDPEVMIKAHYLGARVLEFSVFARMRGGGLSHVRPSACIEFFLKLLSYRVSSHSIKRALRAGDLASGS